MVNSECVNRESQTVNPCALSGRVGHIFAVHDFPIPDSRFTIYHSPFTIYHLPFTIYHLLFWRSVHLHSLQLRRLAAPKLMTNEMSNIIDLLSLKLLLETSACRPGRW